MIARVVAEEVDPKSICKQMVKLANEAGGEDNITVVVSKPRPTKKRREPVKLAEDEVPKASAASQDTSWLEDTNPG